MLDAADGKKKLSEALQKVEAKVLLVLQVATARLEGCQICLSS